MYSRPTLADLVTRTRADLVSRLSADDILRDVEDFLRGGNDR